MLIVGFVGYPGSGKSEATAIAHALSFDVVSMGDVVRAYMHKQGIAVNEQNVGATANALRDRNGMDAVAQMCIPAIHASRSSKVVVDGIRGIAEVRAFKKEFSDQFKLIAITSSPLTRFGRVRNRNRLDDARDMNAFEQKDKRELAWGLKDALEAADYYLPNESNIDEFRSAVASLLTRLARNSLDVMQVTIWAPIQETESASKVARAARNIFPDAIFECSNNTLRGTSNSLETFALLLKQQRIRSTAKDELLQRATPTSFKFVLNKQAASVNKVNFGPGPLGGIHVQVEASAAERLIHKITEQAEQ